MEKKDGTSPETGNEKNPVNQPEGGSPKTGDPISVWFVIMLASMFGIAAILKLKKPV